MISRLVELPGAEGQLLAAAILDPAGKKILARGHRLERPDVAMLKQKGLREIWVAELSPEDVSEDQVLDTLAPLMASGPLEIRRAAGGRVELIATGSSALIVHAERLAKFNASGAAMACTRAQFSAIGGNERFATLRSQPFAANAAVVESWRNRLEADGPLMEIKAIGQPRVTVIYTDPVSPERARVLFEPIARRRAERFGFVPQHSVSLEEETALTSALAMTLRRPHDLVLVASTISPLMPGDAIGQAIRALGGRIAHFLAPVEPGSLLMLGYVGETAVVAATGCYRSPKPNVLDLILPPLLARHPLTPCSVAAMGVGGLLD